MTGSNDEQFVVIQHSDRHKSFLQKTTAASLVPVTPPNWNVGVGITWWRSKSGTVSLV